VAFPIREESQLLALAIFVDRFNGALSPVNLGGIEFAQVQHAAVREAATTRPQTFTQRVIIVRLALFAHAMGLEEHAGMLSKPAKGCL